MYRSGASRGHVHPRTFSVRDSRYRSGGVARRLPRMRNRTSAAHARLAARVRASRRRRGQVRPCGHPVGGPQECCLSPFPLAVFWCWRSLPPSSRASFRAWPSRGCRPSRHPATSSSASSTTTTRGGDVGEFVEITAPAGTDLSRLVHRAVQRLHTGRRERVHHARGCDSLPAGTLVADQSVGFGTVVISYPTDRPAERLATTASLCATPSGTVIEFAVVRGPASPPPAGRRLAWSARHRRRARAALRPARGLDLAPSICPRRLHLGIEHRQHHGRTESRAGHRWHHHPGARERPGDRRLRQRSR